MKGFKRFLVMLPLSLMMLAASAQNQSNVTAGGQGNVPTFWRNIIGELTAGFGTKHDGMMPLELGANIGYRFIPRMYAFVHGGNLYGLYDKDHGKHYTKSALLGGGLGYTFYRDESFDLDLRGTVSSSIGNADWKHVAYDAALVIRLSPWDLLKMHVGVGFRHISSRTAGIGTYNGFYGTIGFGF